LHPNILSAGGWFLRSGIQEPSGGVARYYRSDLHRNQPVSTEITGYTVSALVYLHSLDPSGKWLEAAESAARFLVCKAWNPAAAAMPFEIDPPRFTYFFDCGIIVRGLLAVWQATDNTRYLETAVALGESMERDFLDDGGDVHPILELRSKKPIERDPLRWSRSAGCYQLKAAMAWWDLAEATGDNTFRDPYMRVLEASLRSYETFLPGHTEPLKVMDRLHAFSYFLEGLLPRADDAECAAALRAGIGRLSMHLRSIAPQFERSDVYAQLLRARLHADAAGAAPLNRAAADDEARALATFQAQSEDARIGGGFIFGRKQGEAMPYINPVSTAFALQALQEHESGKLAPRPLLI